MIHHSYVVAVSALALMVVAAKGIAALLPLPVSEALIAIGLGLVVSPLIPSAIRKSITKLAPSALRIGVALLGARLSVHAVLEIGIQAIGLVVLTMGVALVVVVTIGRRIGLSSDLTTLLAVGTAICGNSAIAAVAPVIRAEPRHVAVAIASVTLFGTAAVITYPLVGVALQIPDHQFGMWAGLAINDTSQVVAAGAVYSNAALIVATVVKLVRNAMMVPLLAFIAWRWGSRDTAARGERLTFLRRAVPAFVVGFILLAALRSSGILSNDLVLVLGEVSSVLVVAALGGIAVSIRLRDLAHVGPAPFALAAGAGVTMGIGSLAMLRVIAV